MASARKTLLPLALLGVAASAPAAAGAGPAPDLPPDASLSPVPHQCPIVDRGFIQDGITTITVISPIAPCTAPGWNGWYCATLRSDANAAEGPSYWIDVRWNLPTQTPAASFTWMIGGHSVGLFRDVTTEAARIQDTLAAENVRTVELALSGEGTYQQPANGYPSVSSAYADVLEFLVATGVVDTTGVVGHYGNSGGGLMAANALAFHRVEKLLDGIVFGSSPFWNDLEAVCAEPSSPYYGDPETRARADTVSWLGGGTTPCSAGAPTATPSYACRSLLGPDADTDYPDLIVSIVLGTQDQLLSFISPAANDYLQRVNTWSETLEVVNTAGHQMMNYVAGADTILARIRGIVAQGPARERARGPGDGGGAMPAGAGLVLRSPVPNPARDGTVLAFALDRPGHVILTIHDVAGRRVASLLDGTRSAGAHSVRWNAADDAGRPVASGIYFARLETGTGRRVERIQVVR